MRLRAAAIAGLVFALGCPTDNGGGVVTVLVVASVEVAPGTTPVSQGATVQLSATPKTSSGLVIPGRAVAWSSSDQSIATVSSSGLVQGVAVGGPVHIRATVDGVVGEALVTVVAVPVDHVTVTPGNTPLVVGGAVLLTATAFDASGTALTGRSFLWQSSAPAIADVTSSGQVLAIAPGGPVTITATAEGKSGSATVTVAPRPADRLGFLQEPGPSTAGQAITPAVRVAVQDNLLGTVTGATNPVTIALAANPGGASLGGATTVNAIAGVATFSNLTVDRTGTGYTLLATSPNLSSATSNPFSVSAGAANRLVFTVSPPTTAQSGVPLNPQPAVRLQDGSGNPVALAGVVVTATVASGSGTLSGSTTATTNGSGIATFTTLTLSGLANSYTLSFGAPSITSVTSAPIALAAGPAAGLSVAVQPSSQAQSGVPLAQQPAIQLRDVAGNPVAQSGVVVTATIAVGSGTLGGLTTATTDGSGLAQFTSLAINGPAGGYALGFSAPGLTGVTSSSITLVVTAATQLVITTQPSSTAPSGAVFAQQPAVQLRDAGNNPVAQAGVVVTAAIASGGGTLGGTATASTNSSGVATFANLSITGIIGARTLGFSAAGLTGATSATITITAGAAAQLTITTQPSASAQSGVAFAQQPVIQVRDGGGNAVSQAGVNVTAAIATGGGTLGGTTTVATNSSGVASFSNLSITGTAGDRTLAFSATGLTGVTSGVVTVTAGSASQLGITTQPSATAQSGVAFAQQPVIQLRDASNNPVAQAGVSITAAISTGGGTLGGTTSVLTNANGTATFTDLSISGTIGQRTLLFAAAGYVSIASTPINITAGPADHLSITVQPSASAQSGVAFAQQPVIQLRDADDNAVSQSGTVVTASIATGGGTLGGTATATTNASGVATFTNLSITGSPGDYTLGFAAPALTGVASATITIAAGPPATVTITTQPSATATSGAAFAQQPVVLVQDAGSNPVPGTGVTATIASGPTGATFVGTATATTNGSGVATFSGLGLSGTVGSYTLTFTAGSATSVASNAVVLSAGPAASVAANSAVSQTATVGTAVAAPPSVKVTDAQGNPVAGFAVTFAVITGGGTVTPASPTTVSTDAGGVATATSWVLGPTAGTNNNTVNANATGLAGSPVTFTASGTAGPASQLTYNTQPSASAQSGVAFAQQPVLLVQDAGNNPLSGIVVTATVTGSPAGVSLIGTTTATSASTGLATFTDLGLNGPAGTYTLTFTAGALSSGASNSITLAAAVATKLAVTTQPSATTANDAPFPQQPAVQLQSAASNPVPQSGTMVTAAIASGGGTLGGTLTQPTDVNGLATFTDLKITGTVGSRTLSFTSGSLTQAVSNGINVVAGTATQLTYTTQPSTSAQDGVAFAQQPVLLLGDVSGNPVAGTVVTAATVSPAGASFVGTTTATTDAAGHATFSNLGLTGTSGTYTVTFTAGALSSGASNTITLTGAATQLSITTQPPTHSPNNTQLSPQPVIQLRDASNNPVGQANVTITAALVVSINCVGSLGGSKTAVTSSAGEAAFATLKINLTAGIGTCQLVFTAPGPLTSPPSDSIFIP